jgi:hypothetical protein
MKKSAHIPSTYYCHAGCGREVPFPLTNCSLWCSGEADPMVYKPTIGLRAKPDKGRRYSEFLKEKAEQEEQKRLTRKKK